MARTEQPPVSFENCLAKHSTDKALLVDIPDHGEKWIPHSQIHDDSEVFDADNNAEGTLVITHWIATQKGLV